MQVALLQEPFCKAESEVALLTDWQIVHRYLTPAAERAEKARAELPQPAAGPAPRPAPRGGDRGPDHEPGTPEHRRQVIGAFVGTMGMSPERAARLYEKQLAEWKAGRE